MRPKNSSRLVNPLFGHDSPDDPYGFVGQGHADEARRLFLQQAPHPVCGVRLRVPDPSEYGRGPDNEKFAQIAIAHLRDPPQPALSAGRILSRHQSEPGREWTCHGLMPLL